ncbi:MAG TPA: hypothetical protein VII92_07375 [Anaerolineae bacterium]
MNADFSSYPSNQRKSASKNFFFPLKSEEPIFSKFLRMRLAACADWNLADVGRLCVTLGANSTGALWYILRMHHRRTPHVFASGFN